MQVYKQKHNRKQYIPPVIFMEEIEDDSSLLAPNSATGTVEDTWNGDDGGDFNGDIEEAKSVDFEFQLNDDLFL